MASKQGRQIMEKINDRITTAALSSKANRSYGVVKLSEFVKKEKKKVSL